MHEVAAFSLFIVQWAAFLQFVVQWAGKVEGRKLSSLGVWVGLGQDPPAWRNFHHQLKRNSM